MRNPFFKRRGKKEPKTTTKDQVLLLFFSDSKRLKANTGGFFVTTLPLSDSSKQPMKQEQSVGQGRGDCRMRHWC